MTRPGASITIRHAWLQKHPSPVASGGEFHWYPREGDRELRASCVERLRGVDPPAVLWELARGRVVWAQPFAAIAPHDGRRYVGLVLSILEAQGASPAELLAELVAPPAAPLTADAAPPKRSSIRTVSGEPTMSVALRGFSSLDIELDADDDELVEHVRRPPVEPSAHDADVVGVARSLLSGGVARLGDPSDPELAVWAASLERWMPDAICERTRRGAWSPTQQVKAADRVAELVAEAWRTPTSNAARAWRLLVELAEAREQTVDEVEAELAAIERVPLGALSDEERDALAGKREFVDALHAWGRGVLDQCPTAGTLTTRLADAVALRVLAQLVDGRDAHDAIAEARWYALLPAARRRTLLDAVAERAVSLRGLVEVKHA